MVLKEVDLRGHVSGIMREVQKEEYKKFQDEVWYYTIDDKINGEPPYMIDDRYPEI